MTTLLFDTDAMDQTAGMLRDTAGEYQMLSSQVSADADLGSMPAQTGSMPAQTGSMGRRRHLIGLADARPAHVGSLFGWRAPRLAIR